MKNADLHDQHDRGGEEGAWIELADRAGQRLDDLVEDEN
jgi:hypothetical protein